MTKLSKAKQEEIIPTVNVEIEEEDQPPLSLIIPQKPEDFLSELPSDKEECIRLITNNSAFLASQTTLRFWYIGRIISSMEDAGENDIIDELHLRIGYKKRMLQYIKAVYLKFPTFKFVQTACNCGLEWTDFKLMTKVKDPEAREQLLQRLIEGKLRRGSIEDEIKRLNALNDPSPSPSLNTDEDEELLEDEGPVRPAKYFANMTKLADTFNEKFIEALTEYDQYYECAQNAELVDEDEYERVIENAEDLLEVVKTLVANLNDFHKRCKSHFTK